MLEDPRTYASPVTSETTLLCVFSYNMGRSLRTCLESVEQFCPGFKTIVYDDNSEDPATRDLLVQRRTSLHDVVVNTDPKTGKRHGNLYVNIQNAVKRAEAEGFAYLFLIQDDMQFVRPFAREISDQYQTLFASSDKVLQVDCRFLRRGKYQIARDLRAYSYGPGSAYADVGIVHLGRLKTSEWTLQEGERSNSEELARLGYHQLFPFSPIIMHVPFPKLFRQGRKKMRLFPFNRGKYSFHAMTDREIAAMDSRPIEDLPLFRAFLRPKNMRLSRLAYLWRRDTKLFT